MNTDESATFDPAVLTNQEQTQRHRQKMVEWERFLMPKLIWHAYNQGGKRWLLDRIDQAYADAKAQGYDLEENSRPIWPANEPA
jgi:hypothetical protein